MMKRKQLEIEEINLQFFADDIPDEENDEVNEEENQDTIDTAAFADLLSDKDKTIEELNKQITELKKSNTKLTLQISSGNTNNKTFEENVLDVVGYKRPSTLE